MEEKLAKLHIIILSLNSYSGLLPYNYCKYGKHSLVFIDEYCVDNNLELHLISYLLFLSMSTHTHTLTHTFLCCLNSVILVIIFFWKHRVYFKKCNFLNISVCVCVCLCERETTSTAPVPRSPHALVGAENLSLASHLGGRDLTT